MRLKDLHILPRFGDRNGYLYVEHCTVDQEEKAIAIHDKTGLTPVPCASLALLMLGPGTKITHKAIVTLADCGCLVAWCGEQGVRYYAAGQGTTRSATNILRQAELCMDPDKRLRVVRNLYAYRFPDPLEPSLSLEQIRGMEGARVRTAYRKASEETGIPWTGRSYQRGNWGAADPVNRSLSSGNSCLYGICHAAIAALGFSPALGFVHTGKQLSFVYDIADLYKAETTIPLAFQIAAGGDADVERRTRHACRDLFAHEKILPRICRDLIRLMEIPEDETEEELTRDWDSDPAKPAQIWNSKGENLEGGVRYKLPEAGDQECSF